MTRRIEFFDTATGKLMENQNNFSVGCNGEIYYTPWGLVEYDSLCPVPVREHLVGWRVVNED